MHEQPARSILVVDGCNLFSEPIRQILEHRGFAILAAKSPVIASALLRTHRSKIDLAVIDIAPPTAATLDLAAEVERLQPALPVLYLAGAEKSIARCSIEAHAPNSVLVTPFTEEQLLDRVGRALAIEVAARHAPEEEAWQSLIVASDPIQSGSTILHMYELGQDTLAAHHIAMLQVGRIHHSVRPTNCHAAPYGLVVRAKDVARARALLAQATVIKQLVSAA
jgi:DNA-binding NtrC family response regulator